MLLIKASRMKLRSLVNILFLATIFCPTNIPLITAQDLKNNDTGSSEGESITSKNLECLAYGNDSEPTNICITPECVNIAGQILLDIDESVDPCEDFYKFSCGGYITRNDIIPYDSVITEEKVAIVKFRLILKRFLESNVTESDPGYIKNVKLYFQSCMKEVTEKDRNESLTRLDQIILSLGGWPVVEGNRWNEADFNWVDTFLSLYQKGFSRRMLKVYTEIAGVKGRNKLSIELEADRADDLKYMNISAGLNDPEVNDEYKRMVKLAVRHGADKETAEKDMMDVLNFRIAREQVHLKKDGKNRTNETKIQNLIDAYPQINWLKLIRGMINYPVSEDFKVICTDFCYTFAELVISTDKRTIANFMMWYVMADFYNDLYNTPRQIHYCIMSMEENRLTAAYRSYFARNVFKNQRTDKIHEIMNYLKKGLNNVFDHVDWMDDDIRRNAKDRINGIGGLIGYPKELWNDTFMTNYYENLTLTNGSHIWNLLEVRKFRRSISVAHYISQQFAVDSWWNYFLGGDYIVGGYFQLLSAFVMPPFYFDTRFYKGGPQYLNFGNIGSTIAHEMLHAWPQEGYRNYLTTDLETDTDVNGMNWTAPLREIRNRKWNCVVEKYSNYTSEYVQQTGKKTLDDDMCDIGGIKATYLAYQSWVRDHGPEKSLPGVKYSPNQLFWMSFANKFCEEMTDNPAKIKVLLRWAKHSLMKHRINGAVSEQPEFSEDFKCKENSKMNPQNKCRVWG